MKAVSLVCRSDFERGFWGYRIAVFRVSLHPEGTPFWTECTSSQAVPPPVLPLSRNGTIPLSPTVCLRAARMYASSIKLRYVDRLYNGSYVAFDLSPLELLAAASEE